MGGSSLFEIGNGSAEVLVQRLPGDDQRRYAFHSNRFSLRNARLGFAQVNDFDVIACWIDGISELPLGGDTDRATGVVEDGGWLLVRTPNDIAQKKPR